MLGWVTRDFTALGLATPRLDAELLLSHAMGCDRVRLYMDMQRPLLAAELDAVRELVRRRRKREPVAYILGRREFYRRELEVTPDVLVPRPETELLVDRALEAAAAGATRALDLCTGSGAVALTLALERPGLQVDATDLSPRPCRWPRATWRATRSRSACGCGRATLFEALPAEASYPLVVANPPYVGEREWPALAPEITRARAARRAAGRR